MEARDGMNETPLHIAVKAKSPTITVEILLRHGVDPNATDDNGLSCLNKAKGNSAVVHQLIKSGANASSGKKPFILDAIDRMDLVTVRLLASLGTDFNRKPQPVEDEKSNSDSDDKKAMSRGPRKVLEYQYTYYPIHLASLKKFNDPVSRPKMVPIIEILLKSGANPFLCFKDNDSILHSICQSSGILEPFLSLPKLDLEARDSTGRTLLLVACCNPESRNLFCR